MSREVEKTLDSIGVSHLWKRMVEYVNGIMPKKTSDLVNDAGFITDFSELPPDQREALRGPRGLQGNQGDQGNPGEPGRGIESIRKTSSSGLTDTYTVTFTDGSSYQYNVVNGKDGADASTQGISYNDLNDKPTIPANLSELQDDAGHRTVSDTEKATWNNKSDFSGNYNDLSEAPDFKTINGESIIGTGDIVIQGSGGDQIQSDWNQSDSTKVDYIKNKPDVYEKPDTGIPSTDLSSAVQTSLGKADTALQEQVKANWNEADTSSAAYIQNKPSHLVSTDSYDGTGIVVPNDAQRLSSMMGYYECNTSGSTAAKVVDASGYVLSNGGCIRIKMTNANTAANATLNINSTGAKALYYDGAQASSTNTWEAGEVLEVYYDGTQYQCASGGGGKFATGERVKDTSITDTISSDMDALPTCEAIMGELDNLLGVDYPVDLSQLTIQGLSLGSTTWYGNASTQKHIAVPVQVGEEYILSASRTGFYAFVTSSYSPPYNSGSAIPFVPSQSSRYTLENGTAQTITIPASTAYLILTTVDGGGNSVQWTLVRDGELDKIQFSSGERLKDVSITNMVTAGSDALPTSDAVYNLAINPPIYEEVDLSEYDTSACSLGGSRWYSQGQHKAIPVEAGETIMLEMTEYDGHTSGNYNGWYVFVTSLYSPPYSNGDSIPSTGQDSRISAPLGVQLTLTVPNNAAYLILTTKDGSGKYPTWSLNRSVLLSDVLDDITNDLGELNPAVKQLHDDVYGVAAGEVTATWKEWKSSGTAPQRIYAICNDKTVLNGVVRVKLSDYSTYSVGIVVQNGTGWITSGDNIISDTGWKTEDCTHVISASEVGYNIRISIKRNDNGSISPSDAASIVSLLEYKYDGSASSVISRLDSLEYEQSHLPQRIPMEVLPSANYVGAKMDLGNHTFSSENIGSFAATDSYVQGAAVYGDYLFQFYNTNNYILIIKLSTGQTVQTIQLTANPNCHSNTASFGGQFYDVNDEFPCVYVSSEGEKKTYVYRITGTEGAFVLTLVQTLSYDIGYYYPNLNVDAPNNRGVLVGYKANSYQSADGNMMMCCCFDLPDVTAGNKVLENSYNEFSFPFIYACQSAFSKYGKLYQCFGNTSAGLQIGGIIVVDYILHNVVTFVDLHTVGNFEPEGLGEWDGGLVITTQGRQIIKLIF